jgi:DNA-binding transcriptional MerR regulator
MPEPRPHLTVGELAERSGVARSAIRFYEKRGLIEAQRSPGNHRLFPRDALRIISVIRAAQAVGLSLDEIGAALDRLPGDRAPTHADWRRISRGRRAAPPSKRCATTSAPASAAAVSRSRTARSSTRMTPHAPSVPVRATSSEMTPATPRRRSQPSDDARPQSAQSRRRANI